MASRFYKEITKRLLRLKGFTKMRTLSVQQKSARKKKVTEEIEILTGMEDEEEVRDFLKSNGANASGTKNCSTP